ncbi:LADA_0G12662g1_1 [Lachancea dasiensis]|uniref:Spindle pole body component SPC42 n=1 Tax=Lachancea dasiensis TaxID=1072105 RepID=A0A1G4JVI8_9SACH|nr:LADA_0G12662g1_1 [Lachancea dasiensis]
MNLSPTPRRYNSRGYDIPRAQDELFHPYNKEPPMMPSDRIVPEEYRVNSQMINKLIKQNKDLTLQLDRKQDEIDRLNVLVGSLRGKLIKYTELNKKLHTQAQSQSQPQVQSPDFPPVEALQIKKTRGSPEEASHSSAAFRESQVETRIGDIYSKLEALTTLMTNSVGATSGTVPTTQHPSRPASNSPAAPESVLRRAVHGASEDDILTQESAELKSLETQIDFLKRKLLIKRENELRKLSLNKELLDLMDKLDISKSTIPSHHSPPTVDDPNNTPPHCDQCHQSSSSSQATANGKLPSHSTSQNHSRHPPYMSMSQALETPTPARRNPNKANDTLW